MPKRKCEGISSAHATQTDKTRPDNNKFESVGTRARVRQAIASASKNDIVATSQSEDVTTSPKHRRVKKAKKSKIVLGNENEEVKPAPERKKKSKELAPAMPLATRTIGHKLFIGAHVSSAGGVPNSVLNSMHIGANAFALFLKSQRKWTSPPLTSEHSIGFIENCKHHSYDSGKHVVPHGSYLVNLAHTDPSRTDQAYTSFLDDLKRCEALGITLYNFHPGNTVGNDRDTAIAHLASNLNRAHKETNEVVTLLENMAAGGNVLGSTFEDLRDIIALTEDKSRVGVCIDTCHAFAAGYDIRTPEAYTATMDEFDRIVGMRYLRAIHLNDSKAPFASHRDLHANVGTGFIGLRGFHNLVNDSRLEGIPIVLETPIEVRDESGEFVKDVKGKTKEDKGIWAREIKLLESLVGMSTNDETFLDLEKSLSRQGGPERQRLLDQQERKLKKAQSKAKIKPKKPSAKDNARRKDIVDSSSESRSVNSADSP